MFKHIKQYQKHDEEETANAKDVLTHRLIKDECLAIAWLVSHHTLRGRQ